MALGSLTPRKCAQFNIGVIDSRKVDDRVVVCSSGVVYTMIHLILSDGSSSYAERVRQADWTPFAAGTFGLRMLKLHAPRLQSTLT